MIDPDTKMIQEQKSQIKQLSKQLAYAHSFANRLLTYLSPREIEEIAKEDHR